MQSIPRQPYPASTLDPATSVFVSANAGSGKTSLLTARVLALLLNGVLPSKILCLTFTNGAAAEMTARITSTLGSWVMMEEQALKDALSNIILPPITPEMTGRARSLFASVLDAPVGLRLQTIHGFCQSLLARFPLEAGVGTHLSVIDETTQASLLKEARMQLFNHAKESDVGAALYTLVQELGEYSLLSILSELVKQKRKISRFIASHHGLGFAIREIYKAMGVTAETTCDQIIAECMRCDDIHHAKLRQIAGLLEVAGKPVNLDTAISILEWLSVTRNETACLAYSKRLLVEGRPRKQIFTKDTLSPAHEELLLAEQECMGRAMERISALKDAKFTASLLTIGGTLIAYYDTLKQLHGLMDFDDQIVAAAHLLSQGGMSSWVMYKLDGGIDHVLVDEAQDTSPEQWEIVRALTSEFFAGQGRKTLARSLFVVGDEKQSIFRFQGADPLGLATNRHYFLQQLQAADMKHEVVALTHSFRSAPEILTLVDKVFEANHVRKGLNADGSGISHQPTRDVKGYCELWPLAQADEDRHLSAEAVLARQLADAIASWVKSGVRPGDVMVLVRRRKSFVYQLARALKRKHIPVAGVDRMNLLDNIAVKDLLAFAQVLLLPEDDLVLAALLKSPLFDVSEEVLFSLCHNRKKTSLRQKILEDPRCKDVHALLSEFRAKVDYISPFSLFSELLDVRGFRRAFIGRMGEEYDEVLDVFLEQAMLFEKTGSISTQRFIAWLQAGESEIKRDMEHAGSMVRIMTAHAAKGLQAQIVVVADSTSTPTPQERVQWFGSTPLSASNADSASTQVRSAKLHESEMLMEEYRRLLYVALTRAEDMLVVCGAAYGKSKTGMQDGSWYQLAQHAFEALGSKASGERLIFGTPLKQTQEAKEAFPVAFYPMLGLAPQEESPPRPLSPSQLAMDTPAMPSPVVNQRSIQKGVAIHRILQYIPAIANRDKRRIQALLLAETHAPLLNHEERLQLANQALALVEEPEYAPLFSPQSLAEVPVSGMVEWKGKKVRVLGQIDRLAILEKEVWIIDYKSSAKPPEKGVIPPAYLHQMALYAAVLQAIYPKHFIRAALLWTAVPRLDWMDAQLLDEVPASAYI